MIFGLSQRERGVAAAVAAIKPLFDIYRFDGDPVAFREPYSLGFLTALIDLIARVSLGISSGQRFEAGGRVLLAAWPRITGDHWSGLGSRFYELTLSNNPQLNEGADNAVKFFRLVMGKPDLSDPDVVSAIERAKKHSADLDFLFKSIDSAPRAYSAAAAVLWAKWFTGRLPLGYQSAGMKLP